MKYLHTAVRVNDLAEALEFYQGVMGLEELRRFRGHRKPCTIVFMAAPRDDQAQIEVVHYDDPEERARTLGFSHVAYEVENIYATCAEWLAKGAEIPLPPSDGFMAFVRCPDGVAVELLQKGGALPPEEPWASMPISGEWQ
jgi:lactoylglutathione lyase